MASVLLPISLLNLENELASSSIVNSAVETTDPFLDVFLDIELEENVDSKVVRTSEIEYEKLPRSVKLHEDTTSGCGGKTWEAADVTCKYLIWKYYANDGKAYQEKNIIELGSGTGLVGLTLGVLCSPNGVKEIVITDQRGSTMPTWIASKPDIIIASDCVYSEVAFKPLIDTLVMLSKENTEIYLCYKRRRRADKHFFSLAKKKFIINEILDDPHRPDYERKGIHLYLMKLKK